MSCTLTFILDGKEHKLEGIPLDQSKDLINSDGTISVENLLKVASNLSVLDPLHGLADFLDKKLSTYVARLGNTEKNPAITFRENWDQELLTLDHIINNTAQANRANHEVIGLLQNVTDPLAIFITNTLRKSTNDKISFVSSPIYVNSNTSVNGLFSTSNGNVYINTSDAELSQPHKLELLAHELVHSELSTRIYADPEFAQNIVDIYKEIRKYPIPKEQTYIQEKYATIDAMTEKGTIQQQADEILAYFLTDNVVKAHLDTLPTNPIKAFYSVLDLQNPDVIDNIFNKYARNRTKGETASDLRTELSTNLLEFQEAKDKILKKEDKISSIYSQKTPLTKGRKEGEEVTITSVDESGFKTIKTGYILDKNTILSVDKETNEITKTSLTEDTIITSTGNKITPGKLKDLSELDGGYLFAKKAEYTLSKVPIPKEGFTREYWETVSTEVRSRFEANTEGDFNRFDTNYSRRIEMSPENADIQVLGLEYNDLILVPNNYRWIEQDKAWGHVETDAIEAEKASFRPIIKTIIKDGQVIAVVASSRKGYTYDIPYTEIKGIRKYLGDLKTPKLNPEKASDKKKIENLHKELITQFELAVDDAKADGLLKQMNFDKLRGKKVEDSEDTEDNDVKAYVPSNKDSVGFVFTRKSAILDLFDGLKANDLVRFKLKDDFVNQRAIISAKYGNLLEVVTSSGKVMYITADKLTEIIYREKSHKDEFKAIKNELTRELYSENDSVDEIDDVAYDAKEVDQNPTFSATKSFRDDFKRRYMQINGQVSEYYKFNNVDPQSEAFKETVKRRRKLIANLSPKDLVKIIWNIGGKQVSGWYPVIGKTTETVVFFTKNGVQKVNIRKGELDAVSLGAIAYNNVTEAAIHKEFQVMKDAWGGIFDNKDVDPGSVSRNMSENAKRGFGQRLRDYFYMTEYDGERDSNPDSADDLKLAVSQLVRGDVVKLALVNKAGQPYHKWVRITDITKQGQPIAVSYFEESDRETSEGKTYTIHANYSVREINAKDIVAVGKNIVPNKELEISGNPSILERNKEYEQKLIEFKTPKFFESADLLNSKLFSEEALKELGIFSSKEIKQASAPENVLFDRTIKRAYYGKKDGKEVWATSLKFFDKPGDAALPKTGKKVRFFLEEKNGSFVSEGKFKYEPVWSINKIEGPFVHEEIKVGDIITEHFTWKGKEYWSDAIVVKKNLSSLVVKRFSYDKETDSMIFTDRVVYKKFPKNKEELVVEYPQVHSLHLAKRGRGMDGAPNVRKKISSFNPRSTLFLGKEGILNEAKKIREAATAKKSMLSKYDSSAEIEGFNKSSDSGEKIAEVVNMLKTLYNVDVEMLSTTEIRERFDEILGNNPSSQRGFTYNGRIYINLDKASTAEPLHELGHLVLKSVQTTNPELFSKLTYAVKSHPEYDLIAKSKGLEGRSEEDKAAEVFVTLFGEHYRTELFKNDTITKWHKENTGFFSKITGKFKDFISKVFRKDSIKEIADRDFMKMTLGEIFNLFGDNMMSGKFKHVLQQYTNTIDVKVESLKDKLRRENKLETTCYN